MPTPSKQRTPSASELAGHPLLDAVVKLIEAQPEGQWTGKSSDLLALLSADVSDTARRAPALWPASPNALTQRMRYIERGLKARGVLFYRPPNKTGAFHIYRAARDAA